MKDKSKASIPPRLVFGNPWCFLAFGFGSGLAPVAPGTFGTLAALPMYLLLANLSVALYGATVLLLFLAGILVCRRCQQILGIGDHGGIVLDEIVGYLITLFGASPSWQNMLLGFLLFRLFDVLKPWPISRLDRSVHGGFGVMLDDALAGAFGAVCLYALAPFLP